MKRKANTKEAKTKTKAKAKVANIKENNRIAIYVYQMDLSAFLIMKFSRYYFVFKNYKLFFFREFSKFFKNKPSISLTKNEAFST